MREFMDRLPFPVDVAAFGVGLLVGAIVLTGAVFGASLALKGYALTDEVKRFLDGLAKFFQSFMDVPGTGEEVTA